MFGGVLNNASKKQTPEAFYKKDALKSFTKFTGKHLCWSFFFNKVAGIILSLSLMLFMCLSIHFTHYFAVPIVGFEQVNAGWKKVNLLLL